MAARVCEEKSSITARLCWKRSKDSTSSPVLNPELFPFSQPQYTDPRLLKCRLWRVTDHEKNYQRVVSCSSYFDHATPRCWASQRYISHSFHSAPRHWPHARFRRRRALEIRVRAESPLGVTLPTCN